MERNPVLDPNGHSAVLPLIPQLHSLLEGKIPTERKLHLSSEDVRRQRIAIGYEPHLDLVDLWSAQHVLVVGLQHQIATPRKLSDPEWSRSDVLVCPVGKLGNALLIFEVGAFEHVAR